MATRNARKTCAPVAIASHRLVSVPDGQKDPAGSPPAAFAIRRGGLGEPESGPEGRQSSAPSHLSHAQRVRARNPGRLDRGRATPLASHLLAEADVAGRTGSHAPCEHDFMGAVGTSRARLRDTQERRGQSCNEPDAEQRRRQHSESIFGAQGMARISPHKRGGHAGQQQQAAAAKQSHA